MSLYVFDLDGTLIDEPTRVPAQQTAHLLQSLKRHGHHIAIITGRFVLPPHFLELFQPDAHALGNGNRIFIRQKPVQQHPLTPEDVRNALELWQDLKLEPVGSAMLDRPANFVAHPMDPRWDPHRAHGHILPLSEMENADVLHLMFMGSDAPEMRQRLKQNLPHLNITGGLPPYSDCVNVYAALANKGHALKTMAEHLGIDLQDTVVFGDSDNDLEMLTLAGHAVQVGDMPYLREVCHEQVSCPLVGLPEWLHRRLNTMKKPPQMS